MKALLLLCLVICSIYAGDYSESSCSDNTLEKENEHHVSVPSYYQFLAALQEYKENNLQGFGKRSGSEGDLEHIKRLLAVKKKEVLCYCCAY